MKKASARRKPGDSTGESVGGAYRRWRLEEAKSRFSEVVRQARAIGPQVVTLHGQEAVVVLSTEEFNRLQGGVSSANLHRFLSTSPLAELEFGDESFLSPVRDIEL